MTNEELIKNGMEIIISLNNAMDDRDGKLSTLDLKSLTAFQLLSILSTNQIRFCVKEKIKNDE